jgi:hypothetical protein
MVNVLENCNTTLDHCILGSLHIKEDVHVFINLPGTKPVKKSAFPWPPIAETVSQPVKA